MKKKTSDAVKMVRAIRNQYYQDTRGLTFDEMMDFNQKRLERARQLYAEWEREQSGNCEKERSNDE